MFRRLPTLKMKILFAHSATQFLTEELFLLINTRLQPGDKWAGGTKRFQPFRCSEVVSRLGQAVETASA
jgi:hypothetical protein